MSQYNDFLNNNSIFILKKMFPELTDEVLQKIFSLDFNTVTDKLTDDQKNKIYSDIFRLYYNSRIKFNAKIVIFVYYYMINSKYYYKHDVLYESLYNAIRELNKWEV